jgi:murein L,D-transpeptidase YcbB/YkuD
MKYRLSLIVLAAVFLVSACAKGPRPKVAKPPAKPLREVSALERLEDALVKYRKIEAQGGWLQIPSGPKLQIGDRDERVPILRKRLALTGDLKERGGNEKGGGKDLFDEPLAEALRRFQERHGLEQDGALGKETAAALNVPVSDRIRQMELNRDRLKQREKVAMRRIEVNIPDFRLRVMEGNMPVMAMNVVVGQRRQWQTPLLDSQIRFLILNPKWYVPPTIFRKEVLAHIQKDVAYLTRQNMVVLDVNGVVDPATVDWAQVNPKAPQYKIVQREGPGNSLGRIKFMFPNKYAVYLHDTPQKKLFGRRVRALSHGCVRVEKPLDLAEYLMRESPDWTRERIVSSIQTGKNRTVDLPESVPLHIMYLTSWVESDGTVQFRDDIYGFDQGRPPEVSF